MQTIRKAKVEDIDSIKAILFNALKEHQIAIPDNYPVIDINYQSKKFKISLNSGLKAKLNATAIYLNTSTLPKFQDIRTKPEIIKLCPEAVLLTCHPPF